MRTIDADVLKRKAQEVATEAWKMKLVAKVETTLNQFIDWINEAPTIEQEETGEWVKVHGYATPGGDPVWACPKCGKGIHVYGVEHGTYGEDIADHQWVACPNCGMKLK